MSKHLLAGRKQTKAHIMARVKARRLSNKNYMPDGYIPWNKNKTKETDVRIAKYALKSVKGRKPIGAGYVGIYSPKHPMAVRGYVMEHRLKMENKLGRYLYAHEVVHHKNEDKQDNRLSNLSLMTNSEHSRMHSTGKKASIETIQKRMKTRLEKYDVTSFTTPESHAKHWATRREKYGQSGHSQEAYK